MYELMYVKDDIKSKFFETLANTLNDGKKHILPLAVKSAIKELFPNTRDSIIIPIVTKLNKDLQATNRKVIPFESEDEAEKLYELKYSKALDWAVQEHKTQIDKNYAELYLAGYDNAKYDMKLIYNGQTTFNYYNLLYFTYRIHQKKWQRWDKLNKVRARNEFNFNISNNTNNAIKNRFRFLNDYYKTYTANPLHFDAEKENELSIIEDFKEETGHVLRSLSYVRDLKINKDNDYFPLKKAVSTLTHMLDSEREIKEKDITHSWLTHIALVYTKMAKTKMPLETLAKFITTIAKATVDVYENTSKKYIFTPKKISTVPIRERGVYDGLRLLEFQDKSLKITRTEREIEETEDYLKAIIKYLNRLRKS